MKKKVLSAALLLLLFLPLSYFGGTPFLWGMALVSMLATNELLSLRKEKKKIPFFAQVVVYLAVLYLTINQYQTSNLILHLDYRILACLVFVFFVPLVLTADNKKYNLNDAFFLFGTTLLVGLSFNLLILIRNYSLNLFTFLFLITIVTDLFAYISGSLVGRHSLCPEISPKKTIEGLIGGITMGTIASCMFYVEVINPSVSLLVLVIITVSLACIGQIGDLVFSQIKRYYNREDFSNFIPGIGGVLDRLDSIIFVSFAIVIFISML